MMGQHHMQRKIKGSQPCTCLSLLAKQSAFESKSASIDASLSFTNFIFYSQFSVNLLSLSV